VGRVKWKGHGKEGELGKEKGKGRKEKDTEGLKPFLFCLGIPSRSLYYLIN
jgi:hypothetical protein